MAHLDANASNAVKAVNPVGRGDDKDGISTASASASGAAAADTKPEPPQPPQEAGWFHWHEPGTSPEEKKLIFKLDWFLLSFGCLMYFIKQVRRQTSRVVVVNLDRAVWGLLRH